MPDAVKALYSAHQRVSGHHHEDEDDGHDDREEDDGHDDGEDDAHDDGEDDGHEGGEDDASIKLGPLLCFLIQSKPVRLDAGLLNHSFQSVRH